MPHISIPSITKLTKGILDVICKKVISGDVTYAFFPTLQNIPAIGCTFSMWQM